MVLKSLSSLSLATVGGFVIASFLPSQVLSADLPEPSESVPGIYTEAGPAPSLTWAGSYVGLQAGGGQMLGRITSRSKKDYHKNGFAGGIYAGHNWEVSNFVLGLETDLTYLGHKKSFNHASLGRVSVRNNWSAGIKGRVGLPIDRFMPYLSAGVAVSDYKLTANGASRKNVNAGLSLGGGLEYALSDDMHLRADYSMNGLDHTKKSFRGASVKNEAVSHRLMVGVSFKF